MMENARKILWQLGITKSCPLCGEVVKEVGYPEDDILQNYKCSNPKCNFGKEEKLEQNGV